MKNLIKTNTEDTKESNEILDGKTVEIVQKDDAKGQKVLRQVAKNVAPEKIKKNKTQKLISKMKLVLKTQPDGAALAAPQISVSLRIFVINPLIYKSFERPEIKTGGNNQLETVFINPEIIKMSKDRKKMDEGCLSVKPWYGQVRRSSRVKIKAVNEQGHEFTMEGSGILAQIFQHEIDHLDGILFIDKAKNLRELTPDH